MGVDSRIVLVARGRQESVICFVLGAVFGILPVGTYLAHRERAAGSLVLGLACGALFFFLAVKRLLRMEALAISEEERTLSILRRTLRGSERLDFAWRDVARIHLGGTRLEFRMKDGGRLLLHVDSHAEADFRLSGLAQLLDVPYGRGAGGDGSAS